MVPHKSDLKFRQSLSLALPLLRNHHRWRSKPGQSAGHSRLLASKQHRSWTLSFHSLGSIDDHAGQDQLTLYSRVPIGWHVHEESVKVTLIGRRVHLTDALVLRLIETNSSSDIAARQEHIPNWPRRAHYMIPKLVVACHMLANGPGWLRFAEILWISSSGGECCVTTARPL